MSYPIHTDRICLRCGDPLVLRDATFECERCGFELDYIHGPYDPNHEMAYMDDKGCWHDVPDGCMLVVAWEPAKGRRRMWWQRKKKSFCLKCGKEMSEMFDDGPETCDVCGFSRILLDDGSLSYRTKSREWQVVPKGFLLVVAWDGEN